MSAARNIPIQFIPEYLSVSEAQAIRMLGLDSACKTVEAQKKAFKRIRDKHKIPKLPGPVFPLKKLEAAISQ